MNKFNADEGAGFLGGLFGLALLVFAILYYVGVLVEHLQLWFNESVSWIAGVAGQAVAYWPF